LYCFSLEISDGSSTKKPAADSRAGDLEAHRGVDIRTASKPAVDVWTVSKPVTDSMGIVKTTADLEASHSCQESSFGTAFAMGIKYF
jgi:hypothetical protein